MGKSIDVFGLVSRCPYRNAINYAMPSHGQRWSPPPPGGEPKRGIKALVSYGLILETNLEVNKI
jgi:hypothetical protein